MKYLSIILLILIVGCSNNPSIGYMTESKTNSNTGKFETVEYSPYYELEYRTEDKAILARLVITLGPERVPDGYRHTGLFSKDINKSYRDGIVDWVTEIYFINTSKADVKVNPTYLKVGHDERILNGDFSIPPSSWKISEPLIALHSVYGTESKVEFKFNYNGNEYNVTGIAKRMSVAEIRNKYSN